MSDLNDPIDDIFGGPSNGPRELPKAPEFVRIRENTPEFAESCPKCAGSGKFRGYTGRTLGDCFACKGRGQKTFRTAPEVRQQASAYRAALPGKRWDKFAAAHPEAARWIAAKSVSFDFAAKMKDAVDKYGDLTENQMAAVVRCVERDAQRDAGRAAAAVQRVEAAPVVDASKIVEALQAGKASGLIWVKLRFDGIQMDDAKKFPGVLYVKSTKRLNAEGQKAYLGKIADGRFIAARDCTPAEQAAILLICADPAAAAKVYGNVTNRCCVCNLPLTNKVSVETGIGPICSGRMGWTPGGLRVPVSEVL